MDIVFLIARILFSALFLASGIAHLVKADAMTQYAAYKKAPGGKLGVIATGVLLIVGSLSIAFGVFGDIGALLTPRAVVGMAIYTGSLALD